jgi:hypothetical protein
MYAIIIGLRAVHIVTGVLWAGAALFINLLLGPSLSAAGPAGGRVMTELRQRKYHDVLAVASTLAILSGLGLLWVDSAGLSRLWFRAPAGLVLSLGGLAATAGFLVGMLAVRPLAIRMEEIQSDMGRASTEALRQSYATRLTSVRGRLVAYGRLTSGCLAIAVVAMAVARYL